MLLQTLLNIFRIAELRNKILFTLGMLVVYRIGFWIPIPGVDQQQLISHFEQAAAEGSAAGRMASYVAIFSGGAFGQSTIFGLGIMPYISAAIIFQLLQSVSPALKKLREEGPTGQQKIQEYTRYATIGLCLIQAFAWLGYIRAQGLVYPQWGSNPVWWLMAITALTAGTVFLMWLGEQIDRYGIGNGVSLIITAGILAMMPGAIQTVIKSSVLMDFSLFQWYFGEPQPGWEPSMSWMGLIMLAAGFVLVVAGSVLLTVAQRRIPIQQAKHTRGRKVYGGQKSYLPLRVNHGGVMPIIFASSLMIFPSVVFGGLYESLSQGGANTGWHITTIGWIGSQLNMGEFVYNIIYIGMVYFFAYFWITVQFNPEEISKQLRDHGSFIPGLRPGPRTAEYLETVMERITYVGAAFLSIIAVLPMVVNTSFNVDFAVTQFLGGTGLLIVVSVSLDLLQRIEAALLMRNYSGFLSNPDDGMRGPRLRSARGT